MGKRRDCMKLEKAKQVSLILPEYVIKKAKEVSKKSLRPDGLRQSTASQLRQWIIEGMNANVQKS